MQWEHGAKAIRLPGHLQLQAGRRYLPTPLRNISRLQSASRHGQKALMIVCNSPPKQECATPTIGR